MCIWFEACYPRITFFFSRFSMCFGRNFEKLQMVACELTWKIVVIWFNLMLYQTHVYSSPVATLLPLTFQDQFRRLLPSTPNRTLSPPSPINSDIVSFPPHHFHFFFFIILLLSSLCPLSSFLSVLGSNWNKHNMFTTMIANRMAQKYKIQL